MRLMSGVISLFRTDFFTKVAHLSFYIVIGYGVTLAVSPVLTRLFDPEEFGLFGMFSVFVAGVGVLVSLNYEQSIPACADDIDAANVAYGSLFIAVIMSLLLAGVFTALVGFDILGFAALPYWSGTLIGAALLIGAWIAILQYWCIRRQTFGPIGRAALSMNVLRAAGQVGLGLAGMAWPGLALGDIAGRALAGVSYRRSAIADLLAARASVDRGRMAMALWRERRFPLVLMPPMLVDQIVATVTIPFIGGQFGLAAAGQYFLMRRVLDLPLHFMARTFSDVFFGKISESARSGSRDLRALLLRVFFGIVAMSSIAGLPIIVYGPSLFALVFGEEWREAGLLTAITIPAAIVNLGASPVARVFAVTSRPLLRYAFTLVNAMGLLAVVLATIVWNLDLIETAIGLSLVSVLAYLVYFAAAYVAAGALRE